MKNNRLFIILAIALLVAVGRIHLKNTASQQRLERSQFKAYIALEANSQETAELSQNILYRLGRRIKNQWTAVDIFVGNKVQNLYSHAARRQDLEALSQRVNVIQSSDKALIQAIQRFKDQVEQNKQQSVYGFIVTKGTSNPSTLAAISQICQKLAQTNSTKMHIAIIGLASENRLPMSTAVASVHDNVQFTSTAEVEWIQLMKVESGE
ncbi:MAG: hypothetical protein PUP92_21920 [Rhizonema sp. PD38]|nr:hypothetical protein [Rhizonema sp. PD38]